MTTYLDDLARSVIGYTAPSSQYSGLLCLHEKDNARDMMLMSGCALVVRGLLWRAGVRHPCLTAPYKIGAAVSDVLEVAREVGAMVTRDPRPRDIVIVNNPIHVFTVVSVDGLRIDSVDGGQRTANGLETITSRSRYLHQGALDGRPIMYVIDGQLIVDSWAFRGPDTKKSGT